MRYYILRGCQFLILFYSPVMCLSQFFNLAVLYLPYFTGLLNTLNSIDKFKLESDMKLHSDFVLLCTDQGWSNNFLNISYQNAPSLLGFSGFSRASLWDYLACVPSLIQQAHWIIASFFELDREKFQQHLLVHLSLSWPIFLWSVE